MFVRRCLVVTVVCLLSLPLRGVCHAQATPAASPPAAPSAQAPTAAPAVAPVVIYRIDPKKASGLVTILQLKATGDKYEASASSNTATVFALLTQGSRAAISPVPPINASYEIEQSNPPTSYALSRDGVVWSGSACYQLSKNDFKTVRKGIEQIIRSADTVNGVATFPKPVVGSGDRIVVAFIVDVQGNSKDIHVIESSGNTDLDYQCCEMIRKHHYLVAMRNGVPIEMHFQHTFALISE